MAATGFTPILIYGSGTTTNVPLAANLTSSASGAELALNYADGKLFYKDSGGTVQVLATKGTGPIGGSTTQVQYNNAGVLAGSANLTFDGTTLTVTGTETLTSTNAETKFNINNTGTGGLNWWIGSTNNSSGSVGGGKLAFYDQTSNASRLVIDNAGNVGISTTAPNAKLNVVSGDAASATNQVNISGGRTLGSGVYGSAGSILFTNSYWSSGYGAASISGMDSGASGGYLGFATTTNGGGTTGTPTERMRIDTSGNVGIGTTSPATNLEVVGVVSANASGVVAVTDSTSFATGVGGRLFFRGKYNTAGNYAEFASIQGIKENATDGNFAGAMVLNTRPSGSSVWSERMRIDSSGNVGIGTTSPVVPLQIGNGTANATIRFGATSSSYDIGRDNSTGYFIQNATQASPYNQFIWQQSGTERMRIDSSGNVGIGTSSPAYKLSANGTGNFYSGVSGLGRMFLGDPTDNSGYVGLYRSTLGPANSTTAGNGLNFASLDGYTFNTGTGVAFGSQTERMRIDSSGNAQFQTGAVMPYAPAPTGIAAATTLTNAQIQGQIISATGTTYTITMALGTTLETLATWATTNIGYDFFVINTASGTVTMAVNTGVTSLGALTIATGTSAHFRLRRTAANTFVLYRLV